MVVAVVVVREWGKEGKRNVRAFQGFKFIFGDGVVGGMKLERERETMGCFNL